MKLRWLLSVALFFAVVPTAYADVPQSSNYQMGESFVGGGGLISETSAHYDAAEAIGGIDNAGTSSSNYQLNSGFATSGDPALAFGIDDDTVNFGLLSPAEAATATSKFHVSNYTSYGYIVQILGNPPKNSQHTLPGINGITPSQAGTEQYGINLVANTSPVDFGSNANGGIGAPAPGYDQTNYYQYVSGQTIASATRSSGITNYTISYIINVTSFSPGGYYTGGHTLVCIGMY